MGRFGETRGGVRKSGVLEHKKAISTACSTVVRSAKNACKELLKRSVHARNGSSDGAWRRSPTRTRQQRWNDIYERRFTMELNRADNGLCTVTRRRQLHSRVGQVLFFSVPI